METIEALSARIETTEEIQSVVRTMKSLSAVSIRQYEHAVDALGDYARTIELGLQAVLCNEGLASAVPGYEDGRYAAVVIGSDRGLCGRFNEKVTDFARRELGERKDTSGEAPLILAVGARAAARLEAIRLRPDKVFALPGSAGGLVNTAHAILIQIDNWRRTRGVGVADIYFNRRNEETRAEPERRRLTPPPAQSLRDLAQRRWPSRRLPIYRMEGGALLSWLIRQHLFISVYRAGAESLASEHASRLAAMQAAERNIDERLGELGGAYRKRRQETITTELLDIVAGFEAIAGADD